MKLIYDYKSDIMKIKIFEEDDWCITDETYLEGNLTSLHKSVIHLYLEAKYHINIDYYGNSLYALLMLHYYIINCLDSNKNFNKLVDAVEQWNTDSLSIIHGNDIVIDYFSKKSNNDKYNRMVEKYIEENYDKMVELKENLAKRDKIQI